jgi:uncharacterized protein YgiM (DUF1202 family)
MKAILIDDEIHVYATTEEDSISVAVLKKGAEVELGKVTQRKKKTWVEISLPGDQKGYIAGDTKIFAIRKTTVATPSVDIKKAPSEEAETIKTLVKGSSLTVYGVEGTEETGKWFKVRDEDNIEGYVPTPTKLRVLPEVSKTSAIRNIVTGFIFAGIGAFLVFTDANSASNMQWIAYAVIFFGVLQLGQGVAEFIRVNRDKNKTK